MVTQNSQLFRQEALERTASPERLDQLVPMVHPKRWCALAAMGSVVIAGLAWSVFGRIPITVTGRGVLIYPSQVSTIQSPSSGRILSLNVREGDPVKKGQVIAVVDQSELENELQLMRSKLAQLRLQDQTATAQQDQRALLNQAFVAQQRQTLEQRLQTERSLTPELQVRSQASIQQERQALQQRLQTLQTQLPAYKDRWQKRQAIAAEGALSQDDVLQAEREYQALEQEQEQLATQLKQLDVKAADAQRETLRHRDQLTELQAQLKELDTRTATQAEQDLAAATNRKKEIQETERAIAQLTLELNQNSQIVSPYDGRVLELTAQPGQRLEAGMGVSVISTHKGKEPLMSVTFLPDKDGKQIAAGMQAQVTPATVKREEYGGLVGKVESISEFPVTQQGVTRLIGNPDVLPGLLTAGPQIAIFTKLEAAATPTGYRWSSSQGPDQSLSAGMTTTVRITVEERTPISYVLPILKSWVGMGDDAAPASPRR